MTDTPFVCSQCGGTDLELVGEGKMRCPFCSSLYSYAARGPTVVIRKSADVVLGPKAKVIIRGGLEVEEAARLQVDGEITLLERAPEEAITAARLKLQKPD